MTIAEIIRVGNTWARLNGHDKSTMSEADFAAINEAYPVPMELDIRSDNGG